MPENEHKIELLSGNETAALGAAAEDVGRIITANLVALGVVVAATGIASAEAVEKAIEGRVPRGTEELNRKAFRAGIAYAEGDVQ